MANGGALSPSPPLLPLDPPDSAPRWIFSAGAIVLGRTGGGAERTLVERVPGTVPFLATAIIPGTVAFDSDQFHPGFSAGPKIGLTYHGESGRGVEVTYFNIFDQRATTAIGPDNPPDWLVMRAPGGFWQTQDFPNQAMAWSATTNLYSAEVNGRLEVLHRVTLLAGFRWFQLNDNLQGTLTPADTTAPTWKTNCPQCTLSQVTAGAPAGNFPPFWTTGTTNNLYGAQIGVDGKILEVDRWSLDGLVKLGLFDNNAEWFSGVSVSKVIYPATATSNHIAFAGEAGLQLKYRLIDGLSVAAGYEVLWLGGVALAPGQIQETFLTPSNARGIGVNAQSDVVFQGATFGIEYSF